VVIVGGYFAYQSFYLKPLQIEAQEEMFMAERYFAKDSFNLAIYGDQVYPGFLEIADEYGATKAGNLAYYYLGISYLRTGQYELAIEALDDFESDDMMIGTIAIGAKGDAYMELGDVKKAASLYEDAAERRSNEFTTPIYLKKAAQAYELLGDYEAALESYRAIKEEYPNSAEGNEVDKLIARAEAYVN
jgi:tetratricopeptide (TPR) repeat protein